MIKIQCACGKRFNVPDRFRGKQGHCPNCSTIIIIPLANETIPVLTEEKTKAQRYEAQDLYDHVIDSVVGISDDGRLYGSGVLIDKEGVIATNRHVVGTAQKVKVQFNNGDEYIGEVIRSYQDIDLAFLKVAVKENHFAKLEEKNPLKIGQSLFAIGHPLGLQNTFTRGIVSALGREIHGVKYIQTDASINPGNSGGPLFNEYAEVIGINTMILRQSQGLGFALPVEVVRDRYRSVKKNLIGMFSTEYCGICGKNSKSLRFCQHCGVELDDRYQLSRMFRKSQIQVPENGRSVRCTACRAVNSEDGDYCRFCGTTMKSQEEKS
ncbi:MAG: trypsin-like serine protease [Chloroflexi bacterium]|nr:trypsin-like serine protease [Chloroflexota bacterium]